MRPWTLRRTVVSQKPPNGALPLYPWRVSTPMPGTEAGLDLAILEPISEAVESGAGLPEVVRAAPRALDASVVLVDRAGQVLAVAAKSPADERSLMADADDVDVLELRVADRVVGRMRM